MRHACAWAVLSKKIVRRPPGRSRSRPAAAVARTVEPDGPWHRLDHRDRHLRSHRDRGVAERRARARALDDHLRRRLRVLRPVLCGVLRDGSGGRQRIHVCVRDDGRVHRVDHRLGPDSRVRAQRCDRGGWLVRLFRQPRARCRHRHPARAGGSAARRAFQSAGVHHRARRGRTAGDRHQAVGGYQHAAGGDQVSWCSSCSSSPARRT